MPCSIRPSSTHDPASSGRLPLYSLNMLPAAFRQSVALLLTRRFGTFWFASFLSNVGTWAQQVAQPWLLLSLGASPFLLGVDSFAIAGPVWVLTLVGGVLADRGDRRRIIGTLQSIQMLCPLAVLALLLAHEIQPWMIISLSFVVGVTDALSLPSFQSIVPSIVRHDQIPTGYALNSTQFNTSRIVGPVIAGIMMGAVGAAGCFALSALSYVPFIGVALWILPARSAIAAGGDRFDRAHPFSGLEEILREGYLRGALETVFLTSFLCAPLIAFCPVLVRDAFGGTVSDFSSALASFGFGGLLGAVILLFIDPARDRRRLVSTFAALFGAFLVIVAVDPWLAGLPILLVGAGIAMIVSNTSANSLLQSFAHERIRGQSVSLFMIAVRGGAALGGLVTGVSVTWLGVRHALLLNGAVAVVATLLLARRWFAAPRPTNGI